MTHDSDRGGRSAGVDQTGHLYVPGGHTILPRPGAGPPEILEAVLPISHGGWADEHGPPITVAPWQATPRP